MPKSKIGTPKQSDLSKDVWRGSYSENELQAYRRKLAKRANQRLVRLERASSNISGEAYIDIGAGEKAKSYLARKGRNRFSESKTVKADYYQLRQEIIQLQSFLQSKSSTVSGIREIEAKRIKTFESGKWGSGKYTDGDRKRLQFASTKEFYDFFHSETFRKLLDAGFTSEQIIEAYDVARETYEGSDEEAIAALQGALEEFRSKGASLKVLRAAAKGQSLK